MSHEALNNSQTAPRSPPAVFHDLTAQDGRSTDQSSQEMASACTQQTYTDDLEQGSVSDSNMTMENELLDSSFSNQQASGDPSPSIIHVDRPWAGLQTTLSPLFGHFYNAPGHQTFSSGLSFDIPVHFDPFSVQQPGALAPYSAPHGFVTDTAGYTFYAQQRPTFNEPFASSDHVFHEDVAQALNLGSNQPPSGPNALLGASGSSLGSLLHQSAPSDAEVRDTGAIHPTSTSLTCGRSRRARGEARRGQPRPSQWTSEEERVLMQMHAQRTTEQPAEINKRAAETLGKSTGAVEAKYWRLRGGDPKAYKKKRSCRGGPRGGRGDYGGRGGHGGSGSAGQTV